MKNKITLLWQRFTTFLKVHKKQVQSFIVKMVIILAVFAAISLSGYFILQAMGLSTTEDYIALRDSLGNNIWFWVAIGGLQVFQVICIPVSNQIVTVPVALMFDITEMWKVWLTGWISIWLSTLILYVIGRFAGGKLLKWLIGDQGVADRCSAWLRRGKMFYPLGMLLPLPDDIITILSGTTKMNFWFIAISSFITRGIDTATSIYLVGYLLPKSWWGPLIVAVVNILLWGLAFLFYWLDKKKKLKFLENKEKK